MLSRVVLKSSKDASMASSRAGYQLYTEAEQGMLLNLYGCSFTYFYSACIAWNIVNIKVLHARLVCFLSLQPSFRLLYMMLLQEHAARSLDWRLSYLFCSHGLVFCLKFTFAGCAAFSHIRAWVRCWLHLTEAWLQLGFIHQSRTRQKKKVKANDGIELHLKRRLFRDLNECCVLACLQTRLKVLNLLHTCLFRLHTTHALQLETQPLVIDSCCCIIICFLISV